MIARQLLYAGILLKNQFKPLKKIKNLQLKRLQYIVDHAYRNTILYHEKFRKAGVHPSDIQSLKDLKKIPLTTKDEMRHTQKVVARGHTWKTSVVSTTSGSTGKKLTVYYTKKANDLYFAFNFRRAFSAGMRPWYIHAPISHRKEDNPRFSLAQCARIVPIPGALDESAKISLLRKINPHTVGGHPCTLVAMAKEISRHHCVIPLRLILLGGELSTPEEREYIEKVFQCKTFNKYGSMELRQIAWECDQHTMHIDADNNILEVLKEGEEAAPGESGEIVGTNLWNTAMPFIRYKQNDYGSLSDEICECGRELPVLSSLQGRRDDFIVVDGIEIPPTRIVPLFFSLDQIDAFQVVQENAATVRIKIVKNEQCTDKTLENLIENLGNVLGENITIVVQECESITEDRTKLRAVISKVK